MVCLRNVNVGAISRGVVAAGLIVTALGSQVAMSQVATSPNICFQRYLMGAAPKKSSVPIQSQELKTHIDGTDIGARIERGLVTGLVGLEYAVLYPPQKVFKKYNQNKYKWVSRVIYDAFDSQGNLPHLDYPYQVSPDYLRKYMRNGRALQGLYKRITPFKHVHHIEGKDELKSLIQKASATGALCPFGTAPSIHSIAAMINSGLLPKMVSKAEVSPNYWLLSDESLLGIHPPSPEANPFEAIAMTDSGNAAKAQTKKAKEKKETKPTDKKLRRLGKMLTLKAQKLQFKFEKHRLGVKTGSVESSIWKEYKEVIDKIDRLK